MDLSRAGAVVQSAEQSSAGQSSSAGQCVSVEFSAPILHLVESLRQISPTMLPSKQFGSQPALLAVYHILSFLDISNFIFQLVLFFLLRQFSQAFRKGPLRLRAFRASFFFLLNTFACPFLSPSSLACGFLYLLSTMIGWVEDWLPRSGYV